MFPEANCLFVEKFIHCSVQPVNNVVQTVQCNVVQCDMQLPTMWCKAMWCKVEETCVVQCDTQLPTMWWQVVECGAVWYTCQQCGEKSSVPVHSGAMWYNVVQWGSVWCRLPTMWCKVVQWVRVWYNVVQCGTMWYSVVQCGTVWYSVVQCGASCQQRGANHPAGNYFSLCSHFSTLLSGFPLKFIKITFQATIKWQIRSKREKIQFCLRKHILIFSWQNIVFYHFATKKHS